MKVVDASMMAELVGPREYAAPQESAFTTTERAKATRDKESILFSSKHGDKESGMVVASKSLGFISRRERDLAL